MRHPQKSFFDLSPDDLEEITRSLESDLSGLKDRRLFISGGTGFFGKWLLGALAYADAEMDLGLHITVLSRDSATFLEEYPEAAQHPAFVFHTGNVETFEEPDERYHFILHAATDTLGVDTPAQEEERSHAIVHGTGKILDLTRRCGARMLNISSGGIYGAAAGKSSGAREDDDATAVPVTAYSRSKREAERRCAASGLDFVNARCFAFLGPHLPLDAHYAAGNFLRDAHRGGPILVRGDGTALRSYLYPADLVTWLLRILLRGQKGRSYNVGSDEKVSTAELARRISAASPRHPEVVIQSAQAQGPQNIYLPDVGRARSELGLEVQVDLDEAVRRTLTWLEKVSPSGLR